MSPELIAAIIEYLKRRPYDRRARELTERIKKAEAKEKPCEPS